ncbi:hypothetical protein [Micromonospora sp. NPDC051141]|uniref:hypothetical protein n=1 Tax=Micromonospora sp. NPDC051141 TaxID=3364284 RepID=UPI00379AF84F
MTRRPWHVLVATAGAVLMALTAALAAPTGAGTWSYGVNRVQTAAQDGAAQTGMGSGWAALTYKPNGPMVGCLFARDFVFAGGAVKTSFDHMDIRDAGDGAAGNTEGITRWPWGTPRAASRAARTPTAPASS